MPCRAETNIEGLTCDKLKWLLVLKTERKMRKGAETRNLSMDKIKYI